MAWLQLETASGQAQPELIEARLQELGAVALWLRDAGDEPILEPAPGTTPGWSQTIVTALFPDTADADALRAALADLVAPEQLAFAIVEDRDWQAEWCAGLTPRRFGARLHVLPDAAHAERSGPDGLPPNAAVVRLDPGLAFGTGEHPTTAMCLEWLDARALRGKQVLDYGCGSGLLAIAAVKLGAAGACAVDIDPQALDATRKNAQNNGCTEQLAICTPDEVEPGARFDLLVANILSNTLIELGPELAARMAPGAHVALAGILAHQADAVTAAWAGRVELETLARVDDWVLLGGCKPVH